MVNPTTSDVANYITLVLLIMSIVGAFCTIVSFTIFSQIRTYPIKLIMYLCVCIIIGFEAFLISDQKMIVHVEPLCILVAIAVHTMFIANFLWTFCIAFNFYQMIVRRNREAQKLEKYYHIACWGIPLILFAFVLGFWSYGDADGVCYIKSPILRFLCFFIPGLIIISSNAVLFFFIGREIHETLAGAPKSDQRDKKKEFRVYLSIFASIGCSWIFGYLEFLLPFPVISDILLILFSITTPMQGIFIFIFYCLNKKVAAKWAGLFGICIPFCKEWEQNMTTTASGSGSSRSSSSRSGNSSSASASMSSSSTL